MGNNNGIVVKIVATLFVLMLAGSFGIVWSGLQSLSQDIKELSRQVNAIELKVNYLWMDRRRTRERFKDEWGGGD